MKQIHEKNNFIWLTLALVGLLLTGALSREVPDNLALRMIEYSSIALLLLSLLSLKTNFAWIRRLAIIIGLLLMVAVVGDLSEFKAIKYAYLGLMLIFMFSAAWLVAGEVLLTGSVDLNKIIGAIALYLLIGIIWSMFYTILLEFSPGALAGIEAGTWFDNMPTTTYFSFVTLTTLGYGDISPTTPLAEVLVILQAVIGIFYLAIVVASLMGSLRDQD
ncbi:MAG: two pore domain potassium channel family protein [Gammaproteobacteria bacterium]|nr:two pore domain potassium channel family protein [Gammaproteobacteria bacterium]MBT8075808.1 two pore domain potassium channel family protein [Gammaproteobacteria bacterium]